MRVALESQLKPLEAAFEVGLHPSLIPFSDQFQSVVQQERQRLDDLEVSIKEGRQKSELQGQIEMLEDLQHVNALL